jgi:hypothetical protein
MRAEATVTFEDVATKIANGNPPPWLLIGLNHFSKFIQLEPKLTSKEDRGIDVEMLKAAQYLTKWLPVYAYLEEFGFECPNCVDEASNALHELIEILEKDINEPRTKGNIQRRICASVVAEAWRLIHDDVGPRSEGVQQACNEYWCACGCEEIGATGDIENWRRPLEYALAKDHEWIRSILISGTEPD